VVAKVLLTINDNLPGSIFRCPKSCIKLRFHPDEAVPWRAQYGIDIVQTTAARDSPPRLNAQVIAALLMRLCLMDLGLERDTQQQKLEEWLQSLRSHTATHLKDVAWGLDNPQKRFARRAWKFLTLRLKIAQKPFIVSSLDPKALKYEYLEP